MRYSRASSASRGYGHRWRKARERHLAKHPLCVPCKRAGRTEVATVVDHITPHRGDETLFWSESNWMSLCATCHSGDKQRAEKGGGRQYRGCSVDGTPMDPGHHWRA